MMQRARVYSVTRCRSVAMCLKYSVLIFCVLSSIFEINAFTCKTDGGPKESELKSIYTKCLKMQDGKNSSRNSGDQDWKENRRNLRNDWEGQMGNDRSRNNNRNDRRSDDRMSNHDDRTGNYDRSDGYDRVGSRDSRIGSRSDSGGRDDSMGHNRYGNDNMNGRSDFQHDYGNEFSDPYGYQSTQSPRIYKRERKEQNSKKTQFNLNASTKRHQDTNRSDDEKNSSEKNTKDDDKKACALHCFLENLEMTAEDGMPDRYLVTHALTKDVKNEDLKDFLQESIEECFQILDNENTENKCGFSKNLMLCLSEKGRENCDDWKDDLKF